MRRNKKVLQKFSRLGSNKNLMCKRKLFSCLFCSSRIDGQSDSLQSYSAPHILLSALSNAKIEFLVNETIVQALEF